LMVENRDPRGTVFTIYLPVWRGDEGDEPGAPIEEKHDAEAFAGG
jgi:hypothetical protein